MCVHPQPVLFLLLLVILAAPARTLAHGDSLPFIAFWNPPTRPFPADVASCQRSIGRSRDRCLEQAVQLLTDCRRRQLHGDACSQVVIDQALEVRKDATTTSMINACTDERARSLYFLNLSEAVTDKDFVCTRVPQAVLDLTYAPITATTPADIFPCIEEIAGIAGKYVRRISVAETRILDRIAVHGQPPSVVNQRINRTSARLSRWRTRAAATMLRRCPDYAAVYGGAPTDLLLQVELMAHCAVGAGYIQQAFACPRGYLPR